MTLFHESAGKPPLPELPEDDVIGDTTVGDAFGVSRTLNIRGEDGHTIQINLLSPNYGKGGTQIISLTDDETKGFDFPIGPVNTIDQLKRLNFAADLEKRNRSLSPGQCTVRLIASINREGQPVAEYITKYRSESKRLEVIIDQENPRKSRIFFSNNFNPHSRKTRFSTFRIKEEQKSALSKIVSKYTFRRQGNVKYFDQDNNVSVVEHEPNEVVYAATRTSMTIEEFYAYAADPKNKVDAELLSSIYNIELRIIADNKPLRKGLSIEKTLNKYLSGTDVIQKSDNPYFKIIKQNGVDLVQVRDNEVLMCLAEVIDGEVYILFNIEQAAAKLNQLNLILPGGGNKEGKTVLQTAQDELEEETGMSVDQNSLKYIATIEGSRFVVDQTGSIATTSIVIGTKRVEMAEEQIERAKQRADEQHTPGKVKLKLYEVEQLILNGSITDARVISAICMTKEELRKQDLLPIKYYYNGFHDHLNQADKI